MNKKGTLISVEGIDGCGKSTLVRELGAALSTHDNVVTTKEPSGTLIGKQIIELLHYGEQRVSALTEYLLFAASRAHHFDTVVIPALNEGKMVLSDCMADSSLAYQGHGRGLDLAMIERVNSWAMKNHKPDFIVYIEIDWQTARSRIDKRSLKLTSFEQEEISFWQRVSQGFETIFAHNENVIRLDGTLNADELCSQALEKFAAKGIRPG